MVLQSSETVFSLMMTGLPVTRVRAHAMELHRGHANELQSVLVSFLALLQIWILGVDLLLGKGFTSAGIFNVIALVLFEILALVSQPEVHSVGTGVGWLLFIIIIAVRALGLLS